MKAGFCKAIALLVTAVAGVTEGLMLGPSTVFQHGTEHHQMVDFSGAVVVAGAAGCVALTLLWAILRPKQQQNQQQTRQSRRQQRQTAGTTY